MRTALVCDRDSRIREGLKLALQHLAIRNVLTCNQRDNALELALDHRPELVILEAAAPVAGHELATTIKSQSRPLVVLLVSQQELTLVKQAPLHQIDAFLAKPLPAQENTVSVELAILTAQRMATARNALEASETALRHRKEIERAKGLLMAREQLSEEQAYQRMRSQAMARRVSMAVLAEELINSATKNR